MPDGLAARRHRTSSRRTASDDRPSQIARALAGSKSANTRTNSATVKQDIEAFQGLGAKITRTTFPRSPLSFRTASFPRYGWKAGLSDGPSQYGVQLKPAPGIRWPSPG